MANALIVSLKAFPRPGTPAAAAAALMLRPVQSFPSLSPLGACFPGIPSQCSLFPLRLFMCFPLQLVECVNFLIEFLFRIHVDYTAQLHGISVHCSFAVLSFCSFMFPALQIVKGFTFLSRNDPFQNSSLMSVQHSSFSNVCFFRIAPLQNRCLPCLALQVV